MEYKEIVLSDLVEMEGNPNEMSIGQMDRLAQEMKEFGCIVPLQVVRRKEDKGYLVLGGHKRLGAARSLKWEKIPCVIIENQQLIDDEDLQRFVNMRLNVLKGDISPIKFAEWYSKFSVKYGNDVIKSHLGYVEQDAYEVLLKDVYSSLSRSALPKEVIDDVKRRLKAAGGIKDVGVMIGEGVKKEKKTIICPQCGYKW